MIDVSCHAAGYIDAELATGKVQLHQPHAEYSGRAHRLCMCTTHAHVMLPVNRHVEYQMPILRNALYIKL